MAKTSSSAKPDRVRIENINHPGSSTTVDASTYTAMRKALLKVLPESVYVQRSHAEALLDELRPLQTISRRLVSPTKPWPTAGR